MNNDTIETQQYHLLLYSASITSISPIANLYQVCKLYDKSFWRHIHQVPRILPTQVALRYFQLNASNHIKEKTNVIIAFGTIGILQGIVYGHANLNLSRGMGIITSVSLRQMFRGPLFASSRDIISQGIPFLLHRHVLPDQKPLYHYTTLGLSSVATTCLSHPLHCSQLIMQNHPELSHHQALTKLWSDYGLKLFHRGVSSRIYLLLFTNLLNDFFLSHWD